MRDQVAVVFSWVGGLSRYSSELIPLSAMMPSGMISTTSQSGEVYRSFCSVTISCDLIYLMQDNDFPQNLLFLPKFSSYT
jgi:hypothetical protein